MNAADVLPALLQATLASSAAIVLVLALRRRLRTLAGAGIAYAAWWIVPTSLLAGLLPAATQTPLPEAVRAFVGEVTPRVLVDTAGSPTDWALLLLGAWLLGMAVNATAFVRQQRTFLQGIGVLRLRADGMHQSQTVHGLPAAVGLWSPRIVVPRDFDRLYDAQERELLRAHERQHIAHGDLLINAGVAALRCVLWFNPLMHWAARAFRQDQELACDQRVIARHPQARRSYGEAMLRTQLASQPLPLGCHWSFSHPLKERIAMLNQPLPSTRRMLAGTACVVALGLSCGYAAWAAQPGAPAQSVLASPQAASPVAAGQVPAAGAVTATDTAAAAAMPASEPTQQDGDVAQLEAPAYPPQALANKIDGTVLLGIDLDATGKVIGVDVVRSEPAGVFDAAAVQAAWKWRIAPPVENGKNVPGRVEVPVRFEHDRPQGAGAKPQA